MRGIEMNRFIVLWDQVNKLQFFFNLRKIFYANSNQLQPADISIVKSYTIMANANTFPTLH